MGAQGRIVSWLLALLLLGLASCGSRLIRADGADADSDVDTDVDTDTDSDGDLCEANPLAAGCPCDAPEPETCYDGPAGTLGVGTCRVGLRSCEGGAWSECEGQQPPGIEVCDGVDNDCDGETDEGVTNSCGRCGECIRLCVGPDGDDDFRSNAVLDGVDVDAEGTLFLSDEIDHEGTWNRIFEGPCLDSTTWERVTVEGTIRLIEGAIVIRVRSAHDREDLEDAPWALEHDTHSGGTLELDRDPAALLEVGLLLESGPPYPIPRVTSLCVDWTCPKLP